MPDARPQEGLLSQLLRRLVRPPALPAAGDTRQRVVVLEPTWDGHAHLPGNLGLLRIVGQAYPGAELFFVGGATQIDLIRQIAPPDVLDRVTFVPWEPRYETSPLPADVRAACDRLTALPGQIIATAQLLVLCSFTPTILTALSWMGLASRSCAVLHGNAADLQGWRSRNPVRRALDLTGALQRYCQHGGHVVVIEDRIQRNMARQYPWLSAHLHCIPHPLLPEETNPDPVGRPLSLPIRIGFAGLASEAKGFPEFLALAHRLKQAQPGKFEFVAIGKLPKDLLDIDQSALDRPAGREFAPREDFVSGVRALHYLFAWHRDDYYGNAASGVVYDALNQGVPLLARHGAQISEWIEAGHDIGLSFVDLDQAAATLTELTPASGQARYAGHRVALRQLRDSLSLPALGSLFARTFALQR